MPRQRDTIDALELESALDACRLMWNCVSVEKTICILTACQGLLRAISQAFLCFVKSSRKNALTKCNLRPNTGRERGGEGSSTYHCAKMLRLHLSIVNFVCRAPRRLPQLPFLPLLRLLFQSPVAIHSTLCRRHLIVRHFSAANVILSLC